MYLQERFEKEDRSVVGMYFPGFGTDEDDAYVPSMIDTVGARSLEKR